MQRAQERQGKRPLVSEPRNKNRSQAQSEQRAGSGKDETFSEQLADNACAACAECAAHRELLASCGGARQHEVGEIDAGDQQDSAHGAPQHHKRAAQPSADVVLQWHRHHVALVVVAGLGILQVPAHDRRGRLRIANRLCKPDSRIEPADHGDDVSLVARWAVEVERRNRVDFNSRREHAAKVETFWKDADDRCLLAVHVEALAHDGRIGPKLGAPPGIGEQNHRRGAIQPVGSRKRAPHGRLYAEHLKEIGDHVDACGRDGLRSKIQAQIVSS